MPLELQALIAKRSLLIEKRQNFSTQ